MSMGTIVRLSTFGESHGGAIGGTLEGLPPQIPIDIPTIQRALDRRRPGQSSISSPRKETDKIQILSGIFEGKTLGTPIGFIIPNKDARPSSYDKFKHQYRPSHADYTYDAKYGFRDWRGGGRSSARETACRVAAGSIAAQVLSHLHGINIRAWVEQVGTISIPSRDTLPTLQEVEHTPVRCPDTQTAQQMMELIKSVRKEKDTIGGIIRCACHQVPAGLGEPVFDKIDAELAKAMLSIPAVKGFEVGSGFEGTAWRGSRHNDAFQSNDGHIVTTTNHSGGIQGGITNGMPITFRVAFKPVATIFTEQQTVDDEGNNTTIAPKGRHDPCVVPRAVPIVESMAALVICDMLMRQQALRAHL